MAIKNVGRGVFMPRGEVGKSVFQLPYDRIRTIVCSEQVSPGQMYLSPGLERRKWSIDSSTSTVFLVYKSTSAKFKFHKNLKTQKINFHLQKEWRESYFWAPRTKRLKTRSQIALSKFCKLRAAIVESQIQNPDESSKFQIALFFFLEGVERYPWNVVELH